MHWPLASEFSSLLQRPDIAFRDPELKRYQIERNQFGQPRPWTGAFAVVYKGIPPDGKPPRAVRIFTTASAERHERYDAVSEYLRSRRVKCLVDFEYRDASVRAIGHSDWFPLILMDWVQGETLDRWVGQQCRERNHDALAAAAARWMDLIAELEEAGIAHGDLQHANVMVTPDNELKLVDYDGMCVPALVGRRNLEVGIKPYQHPSRNDQTLLTPSLDRFSSMVIYAALRALAADPDLWMTYVAAPRYDKLLFRSEDFLNAKTSPLVADLKRSPDPDVPDLIEQLIEMAHSPMDRLPSLAESAHPAFKRLESFLQDQKWDEAVELLNRRGNLSGVPDRLRPAIDEAYHLVNRKAAWAAFTSLSRSIGEDADRALVNAWNESLFSGFDPAELERPRVQEARSRLAAVSRIDEILHQSPGKISLRREAAVLEAATPLPEGYSPRLQGRLELARQRLLAIRALRLAIESTATIVDREQAIVAAWRKVVTLGCRNIVSRQWRSRIELAEKRLPLIRALAQLSETLPADRLDRGLLKLWDENLLNDCPEAKPWRKAYERAVQREAVLKNLGAAIRVRNDTEIVRVAEDPLLDGFPLRPEWVSVVQAARDRMASALALLDAIRDGDKTLMWERFDARLIQRHRQLFSRHETVLRQWVERELRDPARLGLGPALGRSSVVCLDARQGVFSVRWTWPSRKYCQRCIFAICGAQPRPGDEPDEVSVYYRLPLHSSTWEARGGSQTIRIQPHWRDGWLAVWAMIDLGFLVLASHPLLLGKLEETLRVFNSEGRKRVRVEFND